jgi:type II secretory pathway component PulC
MTARASLFMRTSLFCLLCATAGCGGPKEAEAPTHLSAQGSSRDQLAEPPLETVQAPITQVERADVDAAVAAGVARFIQGFEVMEELDQYDRFVGWKIGKVYEREKFEGLGIGTGDVITSINGLPLERPAHAYEALMSLKTAQSIDVEYLRGGRMMRLSLPIVGEPEKPAAEKAAVASEPEKKKAQD